MWQCLCTSHLWDHLKARERFICPSDRVRIRVTELSMGPALAAAQSPGKLYIDIPALLQQFPLSSSSFCSLEATLAGLDLCPWWKRDPHHQGSLFPVFRGAFSGASTAMWGLGAREGKGSAPGSPGPDLLYSAGLTWGMAPARPFRWNLNFCWIEAVV